MTHSSQIWMRSGRLARTLRHLKWRQIRGQILRRMVPVDSILRNVRTRPAPPWPGLRCEKGGTFIETSCSKVDVASGSFTLLHDCRRLGWPPDWNPVAPKLWLYNLHYFDYLETLSYQDAQCIVDSWIHEHFLAPGMVGWEPYPLSLRLGNWCITFLSRFREATLSDRSFRDRLWESIHQQALWLLGNLETHLLGNHLLENAVALATVGTYLAGPVPGQWLERGTDLLQQELAEQVLSDGVHFERSPMYQVRLTLALTHLYNVADPGLRRILATPLGQMIDSLDLLCHPDGDIALFNDSALGTYPPGARVARFAADRVGISLEDRWTGPFILDAAGYYGIRGRGDDRGHDYLLFDAAPIGPDYLPGHSHGDIFSFELSLDGHRVIVDSGTCNYEEGPLRSFCRSTRAHNTVEIEGEDQAEFWASFRVGRRGRPRDVESVVSSNESLYVCGWHDGYRHLPGRPLHRRALTWSTDRRLMIHDEIHSQLAVSSVSRLHLHPDCRIREQGSHHAVLEHPTGSVSVNFTGSGNLTHSHSVCCPRFGRPVETEVLLWAAHGTNIGFGITIAPRSGKQGASR